MTIYQQVGGTGAPNTGSGDTARDAYIKINDNFTLLETLPINAQVGTSYIPVIADANVMITMDNVAANTITIPANSDVAYPVGTQLHFMQLGAGPTSIATAISATPTLDIPYSLMGFISDAGAYQTEIWAFEVTTGGNFRIGGVVIDDTGGAPADSDNIVAVYNQAGTQIPVDGPSYNYGGTIIDNTYDNGTEVGMWTLAPGIYQVTNENYNPSDTGGSTNVFVTPEDGIGMAIGGPAGTPTAVHTGLRYVGSDTSGDNTTSIAALAVLPALETDFQNRHSAAGWIDGTVDDGHLFQFEVSVAGYFIMGAQTGWEDASGNEGPAIKGVDIGFAIYDAAGVLEFAKEQAETGEYAESLYDWLPVGIYQFHVYNGIFDGFAAAGPDSQFTCWVTDVTEAVRRNPVDGGGTVSGELLAGLRYDRVLGGAGNPGVATAIGDTINLMPAQSPTLREQYVPATALKVGATEWTLFGNLTE